MAVGNSAAVSSSTSREFGLRMMELDGEKYKHRRIRRASLNFPPEPLHFSLFQVPDGRFFG